MASTTDVGSGSVSRVIGGRAGAAEESSTLASVPQIMYRSLQQTTIPPPTMQQPRAGGVTNDRIPLRRLNNEDEYDEVNLGGGGEAAEDVDEQGQQRKRRSKRSKRKRKLSEKAPSALDEK